MQLCGGGLFADAGSVNDIESNAVDACVNIDVDVVCISFGGGLLADAETNAFDDIGGDVVCISFVGNGHDIFSCRQHQVFFSVGHSVFQFAWLVSQLKRAEFSSGHPSLW